MARAEGALACQHRVQLVLAKAALEELTKLKTICTACREQFVHRFTGTEAEKAARAWYFVPPGLPPRRKGRRTS